MIVIPVDSHPFQEQTFDIGDTRLRLTLRYNSIGDQWSMDVYDVDAGRYDAQGLAIVLGVPLMWRRPVDYFFMAHDLSAAGIDLTGGQDLGARIQLLCGLRSEVDE
ncbi:MAG: hypothetical protein KA735_04870 [Burkholderiaceae bacterium]|nr:hypothetical protein [Burkholderiaceae bacterium]